MLVISIYKSGLKSTEQIIENKPTVTIFDKKGNQRKQNNNTANVMEPQVHQSFIETYSVHHSG